MESSITPRKLTYHKTECVLCHSKVQDLTRHLEIMHKLSKPESFLMMYMYPATGGEDCSNLSFHEIKCLMIKSVHGLKALSQLNSEEQQLLAMKKVKECFRNSRSVNNFVNESEMNVLIKELTDSLPSAGKSKAYKQNTSIALKHLYSYAVSHNLHVTTVFDLFSRNSIEYLVNKPDLKSKSKHNYLCGLSVLLDQMSPQLKRSDQFDQINKIINSFKFALKRSLRRKSELENDENSPGNRDSHLSEHEIKINRKRKLGDLQGNDFEEKNKK